MAPHSLFCQKHVSVMYCMRDQPALGLKKQAPAAAGAAALSASLGAGAAEPASDGAARGTPLDDVVAPAVPFLSASTCAQYMLLHTQLSSVLFAQLQAALQPLSGCSVCGKLKHSES